MGRKAGCAAVRWATCRCGASAMPALGPIWHGSTRKPHQYKMGDDAGCFAHALAAVRRCGGVLEHPKDSHAWIRPNSSICSSQNLAMDGSRRIISVAGHARSTRRTSATRRENRLGSLPMELDLPERRRLDRHPQVIPQWMIERYGYEKARKIGVVAMEGGEGQTGEAQSLSASIPRFITRNGEIRHVARCSGCLRQPDRQDLICAINEYSRPSNLSPEDIH